ERLNIATEHNPYSIAAACILLVVETRKIKHITKKKLAEEFNISDATINKTYKKIEEYKNIIFDDKKVDEACKKSDNQNIVSDDIPDEIKEKMKLFGILDESCDIEASASRLRVHESEKNDKIIKIINIDDEYDMILKLEQK